MYSTSSAYSWLLCKANPYNPSLRWKWIWKLHYPEKIKLLVWLCLHHALPTNALRHDRGLTISSMCSRCGHETEDVMHCLRDCWMVRNVWVRLSFDGIAQFSNSNTETWLYRNACGKFFALFLAAVWWIWRCINNVVLGDGSWQLHKVIYSIFQQYIEIVSFLFLSIYQKIYFKKNFGTKIYNNKN